MILTSLRERNLSKCSKSSLQQRLLRQKLRKKRRIVWSTTTVIVGSALVGLTVLRGESRLPGKKHAVVARLVDAPSCDLPPREERHPGVRYVVTGECESPMIGKLDAGVCFNDEEQEMEEASWWRWPLRRRQRAPTIRLRCLPSFLIVGAQKAGTGTLSEWLSRHPQLRRGSGPKQHPSEPHYFDALIPDSSNAETALEATWRGRYLDRFPSLSRKEVAGGSVTFEKSPSYSRFPVALRLASILIPSAHLVFVLRNPTDRAFSAFRHNVRHRRYVKLLGNISPEISKGDVRSFGRTIECFLAVYSVADATYARTCTRRGDVAVLRSATAEDFDVHVRRATVAAPKTASYNNTMPTMWSKRPRGPLDVVKDGDYAGQLENVYAKFPSTQVHVLLFDDLVSDPLRALDSLQSALRLPQHDFAPQLLKRSDGRFDLAPRRWVDRVRFRLWDPLWNRLRPTAQPKILDSTKSFLRAHYKDSLSRLEAVLSESDSGVTLPRSWFGEDSTK